MSELRIENHVVSFPVRQRRFTKRWVYSFNPRESAVGCPPAYGEFWVVVCNDKKTPTYFTGEWSTPKVKNARIGKRVRGALPVLDKDIHKALFFMDIDAAGETLAQIQALGEYKVVIMPVRLDYKNTLPDQKFIIICELKGKERNKTGGNLFYLKDFDTDKGETIVCRNSDHSKKMGFRECLSMLDEARAKCRKYRYSMVHDFEVRVLAADLLNYLKTEHPSSRIALAFKLPNQGE